MGKRKFGFIGRCLAVLLAVGIILGAVLFLLMNKSGETENGSQEDSYSMFSWEPDAALEENRTELNRVIKEANITEIYQEFSDELLDTNEAAFFLRDMSEQMVNVYALTGAAEWALEEDGTTLIEKIEKVSSLNEHLDEEYQIKGVMADIEPYLLEQWDGGNKARSKLMDTYADGITAAYRVAQQEELELLVCIPTFFDVTSRDILERLVESGCDGIAVMNYNREDEYGQIVDEVELASQHQKRIICIYELQEPGYFDLEEINTYYNLGLKALHESRKALEMQFGYDKLSFSYHYLEPLKELIEKTDIE